MAGIAGDGELAGHVVGIFGSIEVGLMAGEARDRHCLKLTLACCLVACVAIHRRMSPGEREPVVVILDLLHRNLPASHGVALLAVGAELTAVNIGVAILAALADVAEHHLGVTLSAGYRLVHAAKRITSLIVIKFGDRSDRPPSGRCMAILTRNREIAVGAMRAGSTRSLRRYACRRPGQRQ